MLGYYGVIDERIDLELLAQIADLRPEWTMALVGPLAKVERSDLPVRSNIIRFGKQAYDDLPAFLACFDVAMMPFARNAATRAISPTKTLEYLAGGKPVVSTPIADVIELYGDVVSVASDAAAFVVACESVLTRTAAEQAWWQDRVARIMAANDWDVIAATMVDLIQQSRLDVLRPPTRSAAIALSA